MDDRIVLNGKQFPFSGTFLIDFQYDGLDTILNNKKLFYVDNNYVSVGDDVFNTKQQVVGKVIQIIEYQGRKAILLQDGFKYLNIHLSNIKINVINKLLPIAYAGRVFQTKLELTNYLAEPKIIDNKIKATMYHVNGTASQLIIYSNGMNISNIQLRSSISPALI